MKPQIFCALAQDNTCALVSEYAVDYAACMQSVSTHLHKLLSTQAFMPTYFFTFTFVTFYCKTLTKGNTFSYQICAHLRTPFIFTYCIILCMQSVSTHLHKLLSTQAFMPTYFFTFTFVTFYCKTLTKGNTFSYQICAHLRTPFIFTYCIILYKSPSIKHLALNNTLKYLDINNIIIIIVVFHLPKYDLQW